MTKFSCSTAWRHLPLPQMASKSSANLSVCWTTRHKFTSMPIFDMLLCRIGCLNIIPKCLKYVPCNVLPSRDQSWVLEKRHRVEVSVVARANHLPLSFYRTKYRGAWSDWYLSSVAGLVQGVYMTGEFIYILREDGTLIVSTEEEIPNASRDCIEVPCRAIDTVEEDLKPFCVSYSDPKKPGLVHWQYIGMGVGMYRLQ